VVASEQSCSSIAGRRRAGQKAQLMEQIAQLRQQIQGNVEQEQAKAREIDWIQQELAGVRGLWKQSLVPFSA